MQNPPTRNCPFLDETVYLRLVLAGGWGGNDETTDYPDTRASNFSPQTLFRKCLNTDFIDLNFFLCIRYLKKNSKRILDPTSKFKSILVFKYLSI